MLDHRVQTFLAVYQCRNFTRAATQLRLSQPAVSQHIRQLESHYGCPLFEKSSRGVEPTAAAAVLFDHLSTAVNDEQRLQAEVLEAQHNPRRHPPLRFACTRTIGDYVAPRILTQHLLQHPGERIEMYLGNTRDLVSDIESGTIDFALVEGSFDRKRFDSELLSCEPYIAVGAPSIAEQAALAPCNLSSHTTRSDDAKCCPKRPIAITSAKSANQGSGATRCPKRPASIHDVLSFPLILREQGSGTREILEKHLAARDVSIAQFCRSIEVESIPTIKALACAGYGVTFIYRVAVEKELEQGALVDITPLDFSIEHDFRLIWQRNSRYAERYRALADSWRALRDGL